MASSRTATRTRRPTAPVRPAAAARPVSSSVGTAARPYVAAVALSGVLLFTLELLSGRLVLPVFGGSPGVWTTTLCFFTAVLLVGYLYAHVVASRLSPARGGVLHLGVAAAALLLTVLAPRDVATLRDPALPEALNVLLAQALLAGPAAFLFATTSPLLSAWYGRRFGDPWWLYAVSNGASFAGLLLYPFVIEPFLPLSIQRMLIMAGLAAFATTLVAVVLDARRAARTPEPAGPAAVTDALALDASSGALDAAPVPSIGRQARWLFAAFVPAGLLSATSNHLSIDLVSAPLVWIGPLAAYLLGFVVAFSSAGRAALPWLDRCAPAAAVLLWVPFLQPTGWPLFALLLVELVPFFVLATAVHGRLALDRPERAHLTRFYLILSAGGALATAFVAIVAPLAFSAVYEYPLLIAASLAALAMLPSPGTDRALRSIAGSLRRADRALFLEVAGRLLAYGGAVGLLALALLAGNAGRFETSLLILLVGAGVVVAGVNGRVTAVLGAAVLAVLVVVTATEPLLRVRTFFGVIEVRNMGEQISEYSGTTLHGTQFFDEERRRAATSYYAQGGPMGDVFDDLRTRIPAGARVGVVGLGVGTALAYARPADAWTFYEIDQAVIDIAGDPHYFTYVADSPAPVRMVLGDARLSIADEPARSLDVLVVDAFNSDSVPVHLLTREALALYHRTLRPGGIVLLHLSNRYYDLIPAVNATARAAGLGVLALSFSPGAESRERVDALGSSYAIVGDWPSVERFRLRGWNGSNLGPVFTDDFANLLGTLE